VKTAVVMPIGPGRVENVTRVLESLAEGAVKPKLVQLVLDGPESMTEDLKNAVIPMRSALRIEALVTKEKHKPGLPQPRNVGARAVMRLDEGFTHAWFLDSDVIVERDCLLALEWANFQDQPNQRILIGRYDWLAQGADGADEGLEMRDPRHEALEARSASQTFVSDLSAGLACFSGNLIWPLDRFAKVGGFWNDIHHGRCEDGELGLRAVQMGIPIGFVGIAQGWHLWHERNVAWAQEANARDVPMLNERHPWVEQRCTCGHNKLVHDRPPQGSDKFGLCKDCTECDGFTQAVFVVEEDGKRFNARCGVCEWTGNTSELWAHEASHSIA
jgi:hypothetical protein